MRSDVIVVLDPCGQRGGPDGRAAVGLAIGPSALQGLDEALCLAVGLRGVGPGEALLDVVLSAESQEGLRDRVALGVVGQKALAVDAEALEPTQRTSEEQRGIPAAFRWVDLHIGQAGVIVDADEDNLVAYSALLATSIPVDPMTDAVDASELLGVNVEHSPRCRVLIASRGILFFVESPDSTEANGFEML